ncbi:CU044_5270 family protein [Actinomadura hibisca]|uniref:CU044_5270 family protein n=1 Tax=Actinomadura hibisca TaxID=68565 RepID=UPI00083777ED|nr:CU044_5270 family protein [Actinomadura hibisca]
MDDLRRLRDRHDALPDPAPETVTRARERLTSHMRRAPAGRGKRSRRPALALGLGLVGAATATVLAVTLAGGGTVEDRPDGPPTARLRPVANAQDLASNAVIKAAAQDGPAPRPHQWAYLKAITMKMPGDSGETHTGEVWCRIDDWGYADYRGGRLTLHKGSERQVDYRDILPLPTDPDQLLARIYQRVGTTGMGPGRRIVTKSEEERHEEAFMEIQMIMFDSVLPPRLRAALYGAMAKIPGVRYEPGSHDLAGRRGVTLYRLQRGYLRNEVFVAPDTYAYLGQRIVVVKDQKTGAPDLGTSTQRKGTVVSWNSVLKAAIVDEAGQRP